MVKPALTREEWARIRKSFEYELDVRPLPFGERAIIPAITVTDEGYGMGQIVCLDHPEDRHKIAAACLHNQPFGFTRKDVKLLARCVVDTMASQHDVCAAPADSDDANHLRSIAARIEALLPLEDV